MDTSDDSNKNAQRVFEEAIDRQFDSASISVCLASGKAPSTQPEFQSLEMTATLENKFREIIQTFCHKQRDEQKTVNEYSVDQKPGDYHVQYVELANYPEAESRVSGLLTPDQFAEFMNEEGFVKHLRFYAIVAQFNDQTVTGLRAITQAQKPHFGKWSVKAFWNNALNRYDELTTEPLLFDEEIDCLLYNNLVFVANRSKFETIFNFYQIRLDVAAHALSVLEKGLPIHNFEEFKKACLQHPGKQGMLARLTAGVDPSQYTIAKARTVIAANPSLGSIVRTEGGEETLAYDPKNPWALLRFLNETTVRSLVTESHFEADNKRAL